MSLQVLILWTEKSMHLVSGHLLMTAMYFIAVAQGEKPKGRIFFDMAHELGHILLHPWSESLDLISKEEFKSRENQANRFASAFLLPKESFLQEIQVYPTDLNYYLH